jgi:chromosome segregation ATPase
MQQALDASTAELAALKQQMEENDARNEAQKRKAASAAKKFGTLDGDLQVARAARKRTEQDLEAALAELAQCKLALQRATKEAKRVPLLEKERRDLTTSVDELTIQLKMKEKEAVRELSRAPRLPLQHLVLLILGSPA